MARENQERQDMNDIVVLSVSMPASLRERISALAESEQRSMSAQVRVLLERSLPAPQDAVNS